MTSFILANLSILTTCTCAIEMKALFLVCTFFSTIQVEDACLVALTTACNARESDGGTTKKELLQFVEEVS